MAVLLWAIVLHYLDDFFAILSSNANIETYERDFDILCVQLDIVVNHDKSIIGTLADFFGIELTSILMRATLPSNKLARARSTVGDLLSSGGNPTSRARVSRRLSVLCCQIRDPWTSLP